MPRQPRRQSAADIYHVAVRGVGRVLIFEDDADRERFLDLLSSMLQEADGELLAWCLMSNHAHLLFHMDLEHLSRGMKRLESGYATYFNKRHSRTGHLFQDRFSSEPVDDDAYLLTVVRYIHANPEKAGIAPMGRYAWSSYGEYLGEPHVCSTAFVLELVGGREGFKELHDAPDAGLVGLRAGCRFANMDDAAIRAVVADEIGEETLRSLPSLGHDERDPVIAALFRSGLSVRQIERITGIGRGVIQRISRSARNAWPEKS